MVTDPTRLADPVSTAQSLKSLVDAGIWLPSVFNGVEYLGRLSNSVFDVILRICRQGKRIRKQNLKTFS